MLPVLLVRYILKMGRDRPRLCAWVYKRIRFDAKQETVYKMIASLLLCSCFIVTSIVGQEDDFVLYPVADLSHPEIPYHHGPFLHYYLSIPQNKSWFSCNNNLNSIGKYRETFLQTAEPLRRLYYIQRPNWNLHSKNRLCLVWWPIWRFLSQRESLLRQ
jgi:hypothetical protein